MLAGIRVGGESEIKPYFSEEVNLVCASTKLKNAKISVKWTCADGKIRLLINVEGKAEVKYGDSKLTVGKYEFIL